jgi:ATP/maltotriose-dependent transcriptional regulator MalT/DNA-binding SARP family transcriptional activator
VNIAVTPTSALLAKLSRPRLFRVLNRERLFAALDAARDQPAVWISGPPGAGKTSLVASYLKARKVPGIWYEVDAGDSDAASLFHFLAQAAPRPRGKRTEPLLALSPEYLADLPGFTRRFFRTLYGRLPKTAVLVFDNCNAVHADAPFDEILRDALTEVRKDVRLIMISRSDPPATLARAQANGLIARLGWEELRLTPEELRSIVLSIRNVDEQTLASLQSQSGGWAVGLVLMLEQIKTSGVLQTRLLSATLEGTFNYFAEQVFDQLPASTRELLLRTAFLPRVTAVAAGALTGNADAGAVLEGLFRQRLFTDRHAGNEISYQYHALFGEFLRSQARTELRPQALRELRTVCAGLLEKSGDSSAALSLCVEDQDWEAATRLILRQARRLVADGRWLTLRAAIARLPKAHVATSPWLTLWLGSSLVLVDPPKARQALARAFDALVAAGDERGQLFAATGIAESHNIEQVGFADLDRWIPVLERGLASGFTSVSGAERLRVHTAFLIAAMLRRPSHAALPGCLREITGVLNQEIPLTARADTVTQLLEYYSFTGDLGNARDLVGHFGPLFDQEDLPPFRRAGWLVFFSYYAALAGAYEEGFKALDRLRVIVHDFGMTWFRFFDLHFRALLHLLGPAPLDAADFVRQLGAVVDSSRAVEAAQYHLARVLLHQALGEPSLAIYHGDICLEFVGQTDSPFYNILFPSVVAGAFVEAGQHARALELMQRVRGQAADTVYTHHEPLMLMVEAYAHSSRGAAAEARVLLSQALLRGKAEHSAGSFRWLVVGFRRMLALALGAEIEADCARGFIAEFGIIPESLDVEHWPWPIRIQTLGGFALKLDGVPVRSARKAQRKPLDLLKALVSQGGHEVSAATIAEMLWPEAEGDAASDALEVTLRRLRKLLGRDEAIKLHEGRLALDEGLCWVDARAFERAHQRADALLTDGGPKVTDADLESLAQRLLTLYPGHFLAGDDEKPWLLACRQRLASRIFRDLSAIGQLWENRGAPGKAEVIYRRGVELDAVSEMLYRRLMSVQSRRGDRAGALATYRRCRRMLQMTLGVEPSTETEAAHRAALEQP